MATYLISDTHVRHNNCLKFDNRPFENLEEQLETLIKNWNRTVRPGDEVWHLGDVHFEDKPKHAAEIDAYLSRLNGKKHLIIGNHDRETVRASKHWETVQYYKELKFNKTRFCLMHYPISSWRDLSKGAIMCHGHSHGSCPPVGRRIDVGVNCNNYTPLSIEKIWVKMQDVAIDSGDGHGKGWE